MDAQVFYDFVYVAAHVFAAFSGWQYGGFR